MFDAGAIQAHLDVEMSLFDRKLTQAEERVKAFERQDHKVRISAVFDNASLGRARSMFAQLDNQISRDAASRLRSSPQGSVLGSLNAMFSPHPVSGSPSPQQAASSGLLGKVVNAPTPASAPAQQAAQQRAGGGGGGGGGGIGPVGTAAIARAASRGGGGNQNQGLGTGLFKGIGPGVLGIGTRAATILGLGGAALGALPAVGAIGGAAVTAGAGLGFAALGAKTLIGTKNVKGQPATQGPAYAEAQAAGAALKAGLMAGAEGMLTPLMAALKRIPSLMRSITPELKQAFAGAGTLIQPLLTSVTSVAQTLLPLLGQAFRATAPLIAPLVKGLGGLVTGLLPGLISLLKAAGPALNVFAQVMATIGKDLGTMLTEFAPVIKPASAILKALLDVVAALFPIIGKLAAIFANALAPVFVTFAAVIKSLLPFLTIIGKLIASLAGAILTDLVAAFTAVAQLLIAVAPSLSAFATALSGIFTVMENSGVFAILGDALEALVKPLARLITALLHGLTPLLPPIIKFISALSGILINALVSAVLAILPPLTQLATVALQAIASVLPVILPLLLTFVGLFTTAVVSVIQDLASGLTSLINAIPPDVLKGIVVGLLAIWGAVKLWAAVQWILNAALAANPIGLIIIAIAALAIGIFELVKHWKAVWGEIKQLAADAWHFIWDGFGKFLLPLLGPVGLIALGVIELAKHWKAIWGEIQKVASSFWGWLHQVFGTDISNFFTRTIPNVWDSFYHATINRLINPVKGGFRDLINWFHQVFGTDVSNFFTKTVPGWFQTAATNIGRFWNGVKSVVSGPVKFVVNTVLGAVANGFDTITSALHLGAPIPRPPYIRNFAAGGKITVGTGPTADDVLIRASKDETVLSAAHSSLLAPLLATIGVPGYAKGGKVGQNPPGVTPAQARFGSGVNPVGGPSLGDILHAALNVPRIVSEILSPTSNPGATLTMVSKALTGLANHLGNGGAGGAFGNLLTQLPKIIITDLAQWLSGQGLGGASGSAIADYAMQFIGKIPYVWGGTAVPGGADCSGFTQAIYHHFGINAPRTSEAQGSWVHRSPPVPGGLAFYHSPAGGADPGHVAIVRDAMRVISQGGGMGPQLMNLHAMPLLWTGVPPGGLGTARGGGATAGTMSARAIAALWSQLGGPGWAANNMAAIAMAESGDRPGAVQQGQPPGLTGWGLYQITPTSGIRQNGAFGNLLNAANNTRAAISLFSSSGYGPWASDPVARGLLGAGGRRGFAKGGLIREPVIGFGASGTQYTFGEKGQEWVTPAGPGGSAPAGQLANVLNIMLPEGGTLAQAFAELSFRLRVAQQQGWTGVMPGG